MDIYLRLWIGILTIDKMSILPEVNFRLNKIHKKSPLNFHINRKENSDICVEPQKSPNFQNNHEKEE